jgi:hypothetical protein
LLLDSSISIENGLPIRFDTTYVQLHRLALRTAATLEAVWMLLQRYLRSSLGLDKPPPEPEQVEQNLPLDSHGADWPHNEGYARPKIEISLTEKCL